MFTRGTCHRQENLHPPRPRVQFGCRLFLHSGDVQKTFNKHCFLDIFQSFTNSFDLHFGLKRISVGSRVEKIVSVVYTALIDRNIGILEKITVLVLFL